MKKYLGSLVISVILFILITFLANIGQTSPQDKLTPNLPQTQLRILISGFEPFGGNPKNPTGELARKYSTPALVGNSIVKGIELPVVYFEAWKKLEAEINTFHPDFILSMGLASGEKGIRIERFADNYDRGYPDNLDNKHKGEIVENGEKQIQTDLPVNIITNILCENKISSYDSNDAGGYLCNHIFYQVMNYRMGHPEVAGAFVHMPDWPVESKNSKNLSKALNILLEQIEKRYRRVALMEFEPEHGQVKANVNKMIKVISEAPGKGINLVAFPEMSTTGFVWRKQGDIEKLAEVKSCGNFLAIMKAASSNRVWVSFGCPEKSSQGDLYNSYVLIEPKNSLAYIYHKHYLYGCDFNWARNGEEAPEIITTPFGTLTMAICHDVVYSDTYNSLGDDKGQILLVGTNWIGDTPITEYLLKYRPEGVMVLVSDRKGEEFNTVYPGNTCVIRADGLVIKGTNSKLGNIPTLIYSFLSPQI